ncbi:hypothetical protein B9Q12_01170 [Candidatus Marsarchaeota G2 archaeon ECH_B_SAG-G06]|uniref:HTH arsR-type domain-containing protein n=2 Tax=Candidatus Marsarchaeota group 2 TaxID=2203771 RepID=A0A2R6C2G3_9ARCH|nr:MAG: hypothetical protein B9Q10_01560 [Candidatus Marsarchaeota G2 archaeon ECH_B_SAG-E12]PSO05054.1 MAG: hypothetical protein B9Q12_01170 [Candidatus Marsarchaeota G2 archaeon ECH_B_SAG-G06]
MSSRFKRINEDEAIDLLSADSPKDVERLKLIAEELDNDTGRAIFELIYEGVETVSEISQKLNLTIQLVSYHVEKLLMAGLIKEKDEGVWFSEKGRRVKHYAPARIAIMIVPSMKLLKQNAEAKETSKNALLKLVKRITGGFAVGFTSFVAIGAGIRSIVTSYATRVITPSETTTNTVTSALQSIQSLAPLARPFDIRSGAQNVFSTLVSTITNEISNPLIALPSLAFALLFTYVFFRLMKSFFPRRF